MSVASVKITIVAKSNSPEDLISAITRIGRSLSTELEIVTEVHCTTPSIEEEPLPQKWKSRYLLTNWSAEQQGKSMTALVKWARSKKMRQNNLASQLQTTPSYLYQLKSGQKKIHPRVVEKIIDYLSTQQPAPQEVITLFVDMVSPADSSQS